MSVVQMPETRSWSPSFSAAEQEHLTDLIEDGQVVLFRALAFELTPEEQALRSSAASDGRSKNIAYDPSTQALAGTALTGRELETLRAMMARFTELSTQLVLRMAPTYASALRVRLASFRPFAIEGRATSERKDDTRLHVDAFASRPNQGQRILRVFCNVNPSGQPRTWNVGEPFEPYARKLLPQARTQWPFEGALLHRLHITKSLRTPYDHYMLQLHDRGKLSEDYQHNSPRERVDLPAGSTWVCFTDQVLHAALSGQYMLEQTFFLPPDAMRHPERSPLRTLERLTGRALI